MMNFLLGKHPCLSNMAEEEPVIVDLCGPTVYSVDCNVSICARINIVSDHHNESGSVPCRPKQFR